MAKFQLSDRYAIDDAAKVRFTDDGYLVAMPRVARTGIQLYRGSELGLTGKDAARVIRVNRPEEEVFNSDSMATFAHKPMTDDHPPVAVNASNWGKYGKGQIGDEVARDGQAIRVPMVLMDGGLVQKFKDGKAELSVGYGCDIAWTAGLTADGQSFDCSQKNITVNHVAVVDAARAGKEFRIGDGSGEFKLDFKVYADTLTAILKGSINKTDALAGADGHLAKDSKGASGYPVMKAGVVYLDSLRAAKTDAIAKGDGDVLAAIDNLLSQSEGSNSTAVIDGKHEEVKIMKTLVVDGITVEVGDGNASEVIQKHIKSLGDSVAKLTTDLSTASIAHDAAIKLKDESIAKLTTDLSTASTKVTTLEAQVKDAALTPAKLDQLVADRQVMFGKAKALLGDKLVVDGKTDADIRKQVVDAKLGDAAKGWSEDQIKISFDTLTAGIKDGATTDTTHTARPGGYQHMADTFAAGGGSQAQARDAAFDARTKRLEDAWKGPAAKA